VARLATPRQLQRYGFVAFAALMAWLLTLPASIALSGTLFWVVRHLI
jgi:phosphate/sulfate permease